MPLDQILALIGIALILYVTMWHLDGSGLRFRWASSRLPPVVAALGFEPIKGPLDDAMYEKLKRTKNAFLGVWGGRYRGRWTELFVVDPRPYIEMELASETAGGDAQGPEVDRLRRRWWPRVRWVACKEGRLRCAVKYGSTPHLPVRALPRLLDDIAAVAEAIEQNRCTVVPKTAR